MKTFLIGLIALGTISAYANESVENLGKYTWKGNQNSFTVTLIATDDSFILKDINNYQAGAAKYLCKNFLDYYGSVNNQKYEFEGLGYKETTKNVGMDLLKIGPVARARGVEGQSEFACGPCGTKKRLKTVECRFNRIY